jgi:DME family drug/metabolite transporter
VALTVPWVTRERRSRRALIGVPITLLGLGLLIWKPGQAFSGETALLGGSSALFFAVSVFGAKQAARAWSPLAVTALHGAVSVLTLLLMFGRDALPPLQAPVLWVVAGGVLCGILGNILFNTGLRRVPTAAASALMYLEPLTATLSGWAFLHEALPLWGLLGGALILAVGVWVATEPRTPDSLLPSFSGTS